MSRRFSDWLACPECGGQEEVSMMAHKSDFVIECHGCGLISEFRVGEDMRIQNVDDVSGFGNEFDQ